MSDRDIEDGLSVWPVQDFNPKYEIPLRRIRRACRTDGYDEATKLPVVVERTAGDVTGWILWRDDQRTTTGGAAVAGSAVVAKKREIPTWRQVFPAVVVGGTAVGKTSSYVTVQPIGSPGMTADTRFETMTAYCATTIAVGEQGVVVAATEDYAQVAIFIPAGGILKAVHRGDPYSASTRVYDLTPAGELDGERWSHLNAILRVFKNDHNNAASAPNTVNALYGVPGNKGLAIQLAIAKGGHPGRGFFSDLPGDEVESPQADPQLMYYLGPPIPGFPQQIIGSFDPTQGGAVAGQFVTQEKPATSTIPGTQEKPASSGAPKTQEKPTATRTHALGAGSYRAGGPFHVGYGVRDKHRECQNDDGEWMGPLHLSAEQAKWVLNDRKDAPLAFRDENWIETSEQGGSWFEARLRYDGSETHRKYAVNVGDAANQAQGKWRWQVQVPIYTPPPPAFPPPGGKPKKPPLPPWPDDPTPPDPPEPPDPPIAPPPPLPGTPTLPRPPQPTRPPPPGKTGGGGPPPPGQPPVDGPNGGPLILGGNAINRFNKFWQAAGPGIARSGGKNIALAGFWNEIFGTSVVFRATNFNRNVPDMRHAAVSQEAGNYLDVTAPAIATLSAFGPQAGAGWTRTTQPGSGRYNGGTASGALWFDSPEVGGEDVQDGTIPTVTSTPRFGITTRARLSFGTPLTTGKTGAGCEIYLSGSNLTVATTDAGGTVTGTGTLWPLPAAGVPRGSFSGTGGQEAGGTGSSANTNSSAFGNGALANGVKACAFGQGASASGAGAIAIGGGATASASNAIAIGDPTTCGGTDGTAIGTGATITTAARATCVGKGSGAGTDSVAVGHLASAAEGAGKQQNVAIGKGSTAANADGVAVGYATNVGTNGVAIGSGAGVAAAGETSVGKSAFAGADACAFGKGAGAEAGNTALGSGTYASSLTGKQFACGSSGFPVDDFYFGKGPNALATPTGVNWKNTPASGANVAGVDSKVIPGLATGNAASGGFQVDVGAAGGAGSTLQTASKRFRVDATSATFLNADGTTKTLEVEQSKLGFFGAAVAAKPTVTGSRGGNAALASALTALANLGLITDSSTA